MAAPYTLKADLDADVQVYYNKTLRETAVPTMLYYGMCDKQFNDMPMKAGETFEANWYPRLATATTPLSATADGSGNAVTRSKVRGTIAEYGSHTIIPGIVSYTDIDKELENNVKTLFATQAMETKNIVIRDVMDASATELFANGKATGTIVAGDKATAADVRKVAAILKKNNVSPFMIESAGGFFKGAFSNEQVYDLTSDTTAGGFIDLNKYHASEALRKGVQENGLVGVIGQVLIFETSLAKVSVHNSINTHGAIICGSQAFGCPEITEKTMQVKVGQPQVSPSDRFGRFTVVSWYSLFTVVSLDNSGAGSKNTRAVVLRTAYTAI